MPPQAASEQSMEDRHSTERGSSHDSQGSPETPGPGKPGRKKNPNSQAARRDQNRIAQREFRLRKQQRIRDLEARVEMLSGNQEDSFKDMKAILTELIKENATLRGLVKKLGAFLGNEEGGWLGEIGWTSDEFLRFVDKADTDTAFEAFSLRRHADGEGAEHDVSHPETNRKRSNGDTSSLSNKRPRLEGTKSNVPSSSLGDVSLTHDSVYSFPSNSPSTSSLWPGLPHGDQSPESPNILEPLRLSGLNNVGNRADLTPAPLSMLSNGDESSGGHNSIYGDSAPPSVPTPVSHLRPLSPPYDQRESKLPEAVKLIKYHLDNYRRNDAYCLPPSLRPSLVQRTVPHGKKFDRTSDVFHPVLRTTESIIDELVSPELRDSMILLRSRYDLVECLHDLTTAIEIHGDDVLAHANWEFKEKWLRRYSVLVEQPMLNICNRWRRERGEMDLSLIDIKSGNGRRNMD